MLQLGVRTDIDSTIRALDAVGSNQIPFATAKALTATAGLVREAEYREMRDVFDRPTPYTLNSLFVKPATKQSLTATVWLKDVAGKRGTPAAAYLSPDIAGGARVLKPFELMLRTAGVLPSSYYAVPGSGATIDAYGNMSRGQINQILAYFRAFPQTGYLANTTDKKRAALARGTKKRIGFEYFVGQPGNGELPLGVWQRFNLAHGSAIKPILIFVDHATYKAIYDFAYTAESTVEREFPGQFKAALAEALATAR